jgi:hypothetical protein
LNHPTHARTQAVIEAERLKHDRITRALAEHTEAVQRVLANANPTTTEAELRRLQGQFQRAVRAADEEFQATVAKSHFGLQA